jgi:hypothetical protein
MSSSNRTGMFVVLGIVGFLVGTGVADQRMLNALDIQARGAQDANVPDEMRSVIEALCRERINQQYAPEEASRHISSLQGDPKFVREFYSNYLQHYADQQRKNGFRLRFREFWTVYLILGAIGVGGGCLLAAIVMVVFFAKTKHSA